MIAEVLASLNILEKLGKFGSWLRGKNAKPVETVATRFVRLFENHGVHRNQIPRFFGHSLELKDVQDEASLIAKLDETILEAACKRFAVRREWLDGAESQVHPIHDFYKHPEAFADFIQNLKANNPDSPMNGVLIAPKELDRDAMALLVLQETIGFVGEKPVYRYHLCSYSAFTYWKARAYLTACIAISWKNNVFVHGISMSQKAIERLAGGKTLLGWQGKDIWELGHKTWDPEDMALHPDTFLKGVDSEQDDFGVKSGLRLWLDLEQKGFMGTGGPETNARQLFQQELAKYSPETIDGGVHSPVSQE